MIDQHFIAATLTKPKANLRKKRASRVSTEVPAASVQQSMEAAYAAALATEAGAAGPLRSEGAAAAPRRPPPPLLPPLPAAGDGTVRCRGARP